MILDGGLGTELERRGFVGGPLWSAGAVLRAPDLLVDVHRAFLEAGAEVLSTATYQVSREGLDAEGYPGLSLEAFFAKAVGLARFAIGGYRAETGDGRWVQVALSLGPYAATLGGRAEYASGLAFDAEELFAFHRSRLEAAREAGADFVIFETLGSRTEALAIARAVRELGLRDVWMSFAAADERRTFAGDDLPAIVADLEAYAEIATIGINCTAPPIIGPLVTALRTVTAKPLAVSPNLGRHDRDAACDDPARVRDLVELLRAWRGAGVTHIGGCCGVGPRLLATFAFTPEQIRKFGNALGVTNVIPNPSRFSIF